MLLPELAENEASGEKARIYAELRRLGGVPMVALIFRHLATRPTVLEWAWSMISPVWRSGELQNAAWRIAREAPLVPIAAISLAALEALGVKEEARREIGAVLEAYNRANPVNLLSMLLLLRLLAGATSCEKSKSEGHTHTNWTPPASVGPLIAMIDVSTMGTEISGLFDMVSAPGGPGAPRVIQSLYRHLGRHPKFLALAVTLLRQRFDDGSIARATEHVRARMDQEVERLAIGLDGPPVPDCSVHEVIERFSGAVIPQMIVAGRLLQEGMPQPVKPAP